MIQAQNRDQVGLMGTVVYQCPNRSDLLINTTRGLRRISRAVLNVDGLLVSTCRRNITYVKRMGRAVFTKL